MCNERNMQTNTLKNKKKTNHIKWNHTCLNSFQFSSVTICLRRISSETKERNSKKVKSRLDIFKRQAKQENCKYYFVIKNIRSTHSKSIPRSNKIKVKKKKKLLGNKKLWTKWLRILWAVEYYLCHCTMQLKWKVIHRQIRTAPGFVW